MPHARSKPSDTSFPAPKTGWTARCASLLAHAAPVLQRPVKARRIETPVTTAASTPPPPSPEAPQLSRLSGIVEAAAYHSERARQCHAAAGVRVDAALYELEQLRLELQAVVAPSLLAGTRRVLERAAAPAAIAGPSPGQASSTQVETTVDPAESARSAA